MAHRLGIFAAGNRRGAEAADHHVKDLLARAWHVMGRKIRQQPEEPHCHDVAQDRGGPSPVPPFSAASRSSGPRWQASPAPRHARSPGPATSMSTGTHTHCSIIKSVIEMWAREAIFKNLEFRNCRNSSGHIIGTKWAHHGHGVLSCKVYECWS